LSSPRRILLIDDESDIREVAGLALQLVGGWKVTTAASGAEGIARAGAEQPDAILLDVMMPELDGAATYRLLQADPATREIPVVLLTAKVQADDRRRFAALGVRGVLAKPFDPLALSGEVSSALGWT
jgi:CheY-like chemotaxis protein